jgi:hypothetical protein
MRPVPTQCTPGKGFVLARYRDELVVPTNVALRSDSDVQAPAAAGHGICT